MSLNARHDLIFSHAGDGRVGASVIMIGMLAALIGGAFMAIGLPVKHDGTAARNAAAEAPPAMIRVIGAAPRQDVPCDQQVWPNIDQRCLVRADSNAPEPAEAKAAANAIAPRAAPENDKLSPLTAAVVDHPSPPPDEATTGSGVQEDTALLRQKAPVNMTAPPNITADVGNDDVDLMPPPVEQPPKRARRHYGLPFHLHFGGFRF